MFEVRGSRYIPGTSRPAKSYPGTNAIWGKCNTPTACSAGITFLTNCTTAEACTAATTARGMMAYTWFHPTFPQPDYAGRCYGLSYALASTPRPQAGVDSATAAYAGDSLLEFGRGGFQGGEGIWPDGGNLGGSNWYIENVMEELDSPREWFFNETTRTLYYKPNATSIDAGTGLPSGTFEATGAKVLFNLTGTQAKPVRNVSIIGLTLRDTAYTYMDPHGQQSTNNKSKWRSI